MPTKAKPAKKKPPAAKAKAKAPKSLPKVSTTVLAADLRKLEGRIKTLEKRASVAGPKGDPGPAGPKGDSGPQGPAVDTSRLDDLERRIADLAAQVAVKPASAPA